MGNTSHRIDHEDEEIQTCPLCGTPKFLLINDVCPQCDADLWAANSIIRRRNGGTTKDEDK